MSDDPAEQPEDNISSEVSERVRSVLAAAESAAAAIRQEAEQQAQIHRRAAEDAAHRYLEDARREADELLAARVRRIAEVSDAILEGGESVLMRLEGVEQAKRQLEGLVGALARTADDLAAERGRAPAAQAPSAAAAGASETAPAAAEPPAQRAGGERPARAVSDASPAREAPAVDEAPAGGEAPAADEAPAEPVRPAATKAPTADDGRSADLAAIAARDRGARPDAGEEPSPPPAGGAAATDQNGGAGGLAAVEGDELLSARLVALQMAVAGSSRDEVESHLRNVFELADPGAVLNDVFGDDPA